MKSGYKCLFLPVFIYLSINVYSQMRDYWPTGGWQTKLPNEVGMNSTRLEDMHQTIVSTMTYVDAFLIVKDGYLVYEKYYNGYTETSNHILCSVTKSVTNILMGILLKQRYIDSLGVKIIDFFPEYKNVNSDPRLNQLTIVHMSSFMTGLNFSDSDIGTTDIITNYLSSAFFADPGTQFKYATGASQVLSGIISKTTGKNAYEFASVELFPKLGISDVIWASDNLGYSYGGFNSYFKPRDMLKMGFLFLNNGIWNGDTIVDPDYVSLCTQIHSNGGGPHNEKYGYNWWITENNGYYAYFAGGYGGQFIYVVPELDLVVAITCNTDRHRENARFLINDYVVPAIIETSAIRNINKKPGLTIYPNPVINDLNIRLEIKERSCISLYITDLKGCIKVLIFNKQKFSPGQYDFSYNPGLTPGYYFITANINSGFYSSNILFMK